MKKCYDEEMQQAVVSRILHYANKDMDCRLGNPNLTKREAIMLADYIFSLKQR